MNKSCSETSPSSWLSYYGRSSVKVFTRFFVFFCEKAKHCANSLPFSERFALKCGSVLCFGSCFGIWHIHAAASQSLCRLQSLFSSVIFVVLELLNPNIKIGSLASIFFCRAIASECWMLGLLRLTRTTFILPKSTSS